MPAGMIRFALLPLVLFCSWAGLSNADVVCKTSIPCKEIWFFNNSNQTIFPVLVSGQRGVDEWVQAWLQVSPTDRNNGANWPTGPFDHRIYINGKTGIPCHIGTIDKSWQASLGRRRPS